MPARDNFHDIFKKALVKDGWTITHDPYYLPLGSRKGFIDLGAERVIAASKADEKVAIEIKSFIGLSEITEFEKALGQFNLYSIALQDQEPDRKLFLAVPEIFYFDFFEEPFMQRVLKHFDVHLILFDEQKEVIKQWIK